MSVAFNYRGETYDTEVPCFIVINDDLVFDRIRGMVTRRDSLPSNLVAPEIGSAPSWYNDANVYPGEGEAVAGSAITGVASAIVTDTATISFGGGPADAGYTATVTIDPGAGDIIVSPAVLVDELAVDMAEALAGETVAGATLTQSGRDVIVVADGGTLVKCTVSVAAT